MAWVIGSTPTSKKKFHALRLRLLLSYLGVMVTIMAASGVVVNHVVSQDLNQDLNNQLLTLAETAAKTLKLIKHEYYEYKLDDNEYEEDPDDEDLPTDLFNLSEKPSTDNNLPIQDHSVQWFDEKSQLLVKQGNLLPSGTMPENIDSPHIAVEGIIRTLTLPVFNPSPESENQELIGYIRVSKSTVALDAELVRLRMGLSIGGFVALGLTGLGAIWLIRQSLRPIEKSFEQLKQFTADASHELRSPLTAIKTSVEVMQMYPERIDPADVDKLAAIASASKQMTRLVEDLLLLSRMDRAPTPIKHQWIPVPIDEILEDQINCSDIEAEIKTITLKSKLITGLSVLGDAQNLKRLFANLLDNALQYTPGGKTVTVSMFAMENHVAIAVEDEGIGIAPENLPQVFDRFWRADPGRNHREGNMGLGLAIAQTIAQAHGGKITVTSEIGIGSCFRVQLPLVN